MTYIAAGSLMNTGLPFWYVGMNGSQRGDVSFFMPPTGLSGEAFAAGALYLGRGDDGTERALCAGVRRTGGMSADEENVLCARPRRTNDDRRRANE